MIFLLRILRASQPFYGPRLNDTSLRGRGGVAATVEKSLDPHQLLAVITNHLWLASIGNVALRFVPDVAPYSGQFVTDCVIFVVLKILKVRFVES